MGKIFIGLLFALLDFDIDLGSSKIGLIPDFIGYIIIIAGLREMSYENSFFAKSIPWSVGMVVYSAFCYIGNLFGIWTNEYITIILSIIGTVILFYLLHLIIKGIIEIQNRCEISLYGDNLRQMWIYALAFQILSYITLFSSISALTLICILGSFILSILLLIYIYKAKEAYYVKILH
jgi:hypothetical protein